MTEPAEAKPEQKQTTTKNAVEIILKALDLAGMSTDYRVVDNETLIYFNDGNDTAKNPTLAAYISKAEKLFVQEHSCEIIEGAKELLEGEIAEIREMLNV